MAKAVSVRNMWYGQAGVSSACRRTTSRVVSWWRSACQSCVGGSGALGIKDQALLYVPRRVAIVDRACLIRRSVRGSVIMLPGHALQFEHGQDARPVWS